MPRIGTVDERFQSYNVEMVEVTGGRFWKPYGPEPPTAGTDLYAYRPPIDLTNIKLRRLAAALAPAYLRVSGTWANATYFSDTDTRRRAARRVQRRSDPPAMAGRGRFLASGRCENRNVVRHQPRRARRGRRLDAGSGAIAFSPIPVSLGGSIAAAEFMNEPDLPAISGAPAGYDAAAYGRDFKIFRSFVKQTAPEMMVLGPGAAGRGTALHRTCWLHPAPAWTCFRITTTERCRSDASAQARRRRRFPKRGSHRPIRRSPSIGLFARPVRARQADLAHRNRGCGVRRKPLGATFLDTFRYLDQLGRLARAGVQVVMHNTLAASDYGLLDETTLTPRPNYWGALLWRRLMGTTGALLRRADPEGLHVYAHCLRGKSGGVALLVINGDPGRPRPRRRTRPAGVCREGRRAHPELRPRRGPSLRDRAPAPRPRFPRAGPGAGLRRPRGRSPARRCW